MCNWILFNPVHIDIWSSLLNNKLYLPLFLTYNDVYVMSSYKLNEVTKQEYNIFGIWMKLFVKVYMFSTLYKKISFVILPTFLSIVPICNHCKPFLP